MEVQEIKEHIQALQELLVKSEIDSLTIHEDGSVFLGHRRHCMGDLESICEEIYNQQVE